MNLRACLRSALALLLLGLLGCDERRPPAATMPVLVAARALPIGHVVRAEDVATARVAPEFATAGVLAAAELHSVVGRQLRAPFPEGAPLVRAAFGEPVDELNKEEIPRQLRAITVPMLGAERLAKGNEIDVMLVGKLLGEKSPQSLLLVQSLRVLARLDPTSPGGPHRVTVEVLSEHAEALTEAIALGALHAVARAAGDGSRVTAEALDTSEAQLRERLSGR